MIFYFTGTGNSLYAARKLGENGKLFAMTDFSATEFKVEDDEKIGIVCPVYFWGIPSTVCGFLKKLKLENYKNQYIFLLLTCGADTGNAGNMIRKILRGRGYDLSAEFGVRMVDNYIPLYPVVPESEIKAQLSKADAKLAEIKDAVEKRREGDLNNAKGILPKLKTAVLYPFYKHGRKTAKFNVSDACVSCGKCASNCPTETIELKNGKPVWINPQCAFCLSCVHRCPEKAIDLGKAAEKHGRYVNPFVKF